MQRLMKISEQSSTSTGKSQGVRGHPLKKELFIVGMYTLSSY